MKNTEKLSQKIADLEQIVKYFEDSNKDFNLDEGLEKYDSAIELVKSIKEELGHYELRIKEIQQKYEETDSNPAEN